jgi:hypothetical protein
MKRMYESLDRSPRISALIQWLSTSLSTRRGLPVMGAMLLTVVSLIVHIVAALSRDVTVMICGFGVLHIAILIGFLGALLADPLGRG